MRNLSLRNRLALAMGVAFLLGFAGFASHLDDIRDELRSLMLSSAISQPSALPEGAIQQLCSKDGKLLQTLGTPPPESALDNISCSTEVRLLSNEQFAAVQTVHPDGSRTLTLRADPHEQQLIDGLMDKRLWRGIGWWAQLSVLSFLIIGLLIHWALIPVRRAAQLAESIGPEHSTPRLAVQTLPAEIRPLAQAINGVLDRLTEANLAQSRFVADTSHALRTPLAALWLRLQHHRQSLPDVEGIEAEMHDLRHLVDRLLLLARCDMLAASKDQPSLRLKVSRVCRQVAAMMLPLIEAQDRRLDVEIDDGIEAEIDELACSELLKTGIDNALLHGQGTITLKVSLSGKRLLILIRDEGSGPPPGAREIVFDRFRKLSAQTRGCGLGLSIAREIVRRYHGEIRFLSTPTCTLQIVLPVVASA
ncbi:MAG: sensor histidine kinase [Scandinavium sp.]|uniref:sensor histidine kinase n=1 Tax=Scandinavium sp. TaxID=2830653 RepID=UPI003F381731